ncbi:MAG: hypothetical protein DRG78_01250 [Epsilonproteobacteria bacterium]|nr:MAG: hypothetical protein DRG78_01250 [Campylobacterota bacterium]
MILLHMNEKDYNKEAKIFVKKILIENDITNVKLTKLLNKAGFNYTEASVTQKINRGRFDFAFLLQIADVLNIKFSNVN